MVDAPPPPPDGAPPDGASRHEAPSVSDLIATAETDLYHARHVTVAHGLRQIEDRAEIAERQAKRQSWLGLSRAMLWILGTGLIVLVVVLILIGPGPSRWITGARADETPGHEPAVEPAATSTAAMAPASASVAPHPSAAASAGARATTPVPRAPAPRQLTPRQPATRQPMPREPAPRPVGKPRMSAPPAPRAPEPTPAAPPQPSQPIDPALDMSEL